MAYSRSIAEAIASMGQARAQGELRKGSIYGNLAQNLGQLPGQAIDMGQQYERNQLQNDKARRNAEFEQKAKAIMENPSLTPEQKDMEMENLIRQDPEKWMAYQELTGRREDRAAASRERSDTGARMFNDARQGTPGLNPLAPPQMQGQEQLGTLPGGNAMSPVGMVPPSIPRPMVHAPVQTSRGPLGAETLEEQTLRKRQTEDEESSRMLGRQKELATFNAELKPPPTERSVTPTELYRQDPESYKGMRETDEAARAKYRRPLKEGGGGASAELNSSKQRLAIKARKERKLSELNKEHAKAAASGSFMSQETYDAKREQIQQEFLDDLSIAGFGEEPGPATTRVASPDRDAAIQELRRRKVAGY